MRRVRDIQDRRRVVIIVEEQAVALGWSFFGPLITQLVTATRQFSEAELDTVRRFLLEMTRVVLATQQSAPAEQPAEAG